MSPTDPESPAEVEAALRGQRYLPGTGLATAVFLALRLRRPLFLEGEPGVGKTALAWALKEALGAEYVRLQCYAGIDAAQALYDWDFPRQLLTLRAAASGSADHETAKPVYRTEFLVPRPILRAVRHQGPVVLLIDEIDRADDEFEAFLLEVLERGDVTIPELDEQYPVRSDLRIVLTSNRTREVHDALKRRCVYHWIEHPTVAQEAQILRTLRRDLPVRLADEVAQLMGGLREIGALTKKPAVSEALDLVDGIVALGRDALSPEVVDRILGTVIKHRDDQDLARRAVLPLVARIARQRGDDR